MFLTNIGELWPGVLGRGVRLEPVWREERDDGDKTAQGQQYHGPLQGKIVEAGCSRLDTFIVCTLQAA